MLVNIGCQIPTLYSKDVYIVLYDVMQGCIKVSGMYTVLGSEVICTISMPGLWAVGFDI